MAAIVKLVDFPEFAEVLPIDHHNTGGATRMRVQKGRYVVHSSIQCYPDIISRMILDFFGCVRFICLFVQLLVEVLALLPRLCATLLGSTGTLQFFWAASHLTYSFALGSAFAVILVEFLGLVVTTKTK